MLKSSPLHRRDYTYSIGKTFETIGFAIKENFKKQNTSQHRTNLHFTSLSSAAKTFGSTLLLAGQVMENRLHSKAGKKLGLDLAADTEQKTNSNKV